MDSTLLEKLILKGMCIDKNYAATLSDVFKKEYFDNRVVGNVYSYIVNHFKEYNNIPPTDLIIREFDKSDSTETKELFDEIKSIDFDHVTNYEFLFDQTNEYLKEKAVKQAILSSVDIINKKENFTEIRKVVEDALCKDLKINLGLDYFKDLKSRLERLFKCGDTRIPTGFYTLDEFISGGFTPYTLSVIVAKTHGYKCLSGNSMITIKNNELVENIKIKDFYINTCNNENRKEENRIENNMNKKIESFKNKYGDVEGLKRYEQWKYNVKKSSQGKGTLQWYIDRHGVEFGTNLYKTRCENLGKCMIGVNTLEGFIKREGIETGTNKYNEYRNKIRSSNEGINTLEYYVNKFGDIEGKIEYDNKNERISDKGRGTLQYFTNRYGDIEGNKRYNLYITRQKHSHSQNGYIEKYGEEQGNIKWQKRMYHLKHTTSLEGFIRRHGEEEGLKRWQERQRRWLKSYKKTNFSKVSQGLFWTIYEKIKGKYNEIFFAELNRGEQDKSGHNHEYVFQLKKSYCKLDFFIKDIKKVIEFDGDYWHGEKKGNKQKDLIRDKQIIKEGVQVLHIKERDYKNNPEKVINECLVFING